MNGKKTIKIGTDIAMLAIMIALMNLDATGVLLHMLFGIAMLILFIIHNALNVPFWKNIFKGRYNGRRIIRTVIDILLLFAFLVSLISGFLFISKLHRASAFLCQILAIVHLGMHIFVKAEKTRRVRTACERKRIS